jgi:CheY-like chemotaxis protein
VKVLVVDPDTRRAPALKDTLMAGGVDVTVASSGSFALTMLEWNRHDVVVSRARIDDMDGHELCAILKADPGMRHVRFVLVASASEVSAAETTSAGVDLVLPPSMTDTAILPLIVRLVRADSGPAADADGSPVPPEPEHGTRMSVASSPSEPAVALAAPETTPAAPEVPRIRPAALPPPPADPPKRYATAATAETLSSWPNAEPGASALPIPTATAKPSAPGSIRDAVPRLTAGSAPSPKPAPTPDAPRSPASTTIRRPIASGGAAASPTRPAVPSPARDQGSRSARPAGPPAPATAAPTTRSSALPQVADLLAMPSGTFQGSMEVLELADLTQAIAGGGKSGRLILALPQGGGLVLFEKGRVVHAEYCNTVGEEAFAALLAACHADGAGRFCFLPSPTGEPSGLPRTIDKTVDRLLLSSATAIDEKG